MSGTQCHAQVTNRMSYTIYSSRCLIREFLTGLGDPESMLYVLLVLMYTLSLICLSFLLFDLSATCAAPQSTVRGRKMLAYYRCGTGTGMGVLDHGYMRTHNGYVRSQL